MCKGKVKNEFSLVVVKIAFFFAKVDVSRTGYGVFILVDVNSLLLCFEMKNSVG